MNFDSVFKTVLFRNKKYCEILFGVHAFVSNLGAHKIERTRGGISTITTVTSSLQKCFCCQRIMPVRGLVA